MNELCSGASQTTVNQLPGQQMPFNLSLHRRHGSAWRCLSAHKVVALMGYTPWDGIKSASEMGRSSLVRCAKDVDTPLLTIYGAGHRMMPVQHAILFRRGLNGRGKEFAMTPTCDILMIHVRLCRKKHISAYFGTLGEALCQKYAGTVNFPP